MKLRGAGYAVDTAATAAEALMKAGMRPPAAIILDVLLPDGRGTDVCRELRAWYRAPIVVLSAVGEEKEKIEALDAGADDYVTKPFSGEELLARLRAVLRRAAPSSDRPDHDRRPRRRPREAARDDRRPRCRADADRVRPAPRPRAERGKAAHPPDAPARSVGPAFQEESNYLHVHVSHLRRKIEPDPARPRYLLNQAGVGYRIVDPNEAILS